MKPGYEVEHLMDDLSIGKNDVTVAEICNYDSLNKVAIYYWSSDVKDIQAGPATVGLLKIKCKK
jgi:hypothetical protein